MVSVVTIGDGTAYTFGYRVRNWGAYNQALVPGGVIPFFVGFLK